MMIKRKGRLLPKLVKLVFVAVLLVFHPTWSLGVLGGDCGYTALYGSAFLLVTSFIFFVYEWHKLQKSKGNV